ncbi:hypothetical protein CONLIGDRAFT_646304 [Coniochaeta ligniaria NRRL 30616]|uniref:Uncharacterized protein n=1 Tax=Coniochaeta ligniaria NRRL 30616 TaxID=1408157 RepID=A0A1J7ILF9_9PEZI|nr:hypothetical protein CONLIGDRAFT_646304 [Coniochaeta ligniaria NRRL 30616]
MLQLSARVQEPSQGLGHGEDMEIKARGNQCAPALGTKSDISGIGIASRIRKDEEPNRFVASFSATSSVRHPGSSQDATLPTDTTHRPQSVPERALLFFAAPAAGIKRWAQGARNRKLAIGGGRGGGSLEGTAANKRHEGPQFDKEAMRALQGCPPESQQAASGLPIHNLPGEPETQAEAGVIEKGAMND